jgi:hypothetical protein
MQAETDLCGAGLMKLAMPALLMMSNSKLSSIVLVFAIAS